jgi:hypothetical protein
LSPPLSPPLSKKADPKVSSKVASRTGSTAQLGPSQTRWLARAAVRAPFPIQSTADYR